MSRGLEIPPVASVLTDEEIAFAVQVVDSSQVAEYLESLLVRETGRRRSISVRALLVGLFLLAIDGRSLHLKAATTLLFCRLPVHWRHRLGICGEAGSRKMRRSLSPAEIEERRNRLDAVMAMLVQASVGICSDEELSGFTGSVGLDATPVPLYSRGPSKRAGTTASDPDGGWYVREGDHRETEGPKGNKLRKVFYALEATIVVMGRAPGSVPTHPNLILGISLGPPGEDPGGSGVALLASVRRRGWRAGYLGADRGYSQCLAEHFHLPARALGYSVVMDYKENDLGIQANSQGAVMVDGAFFCRPRQKLS